MSLGPEPGPEIAPRSMVQFVTSPALMPAENVVGAIQVAEAAADLSPALPSSPFLQSADSPGQGIPRPPSLGGCDHDILSIEQPVLPVVPVFIMMIMGSMTNVRFFLFRSDVKPVKTMHAIYCYTFAELAKGK